MNKSARILNAKSKRRYVRERVEQIELFLSNRNIPYLLKRSGSSRSVYILVDPGGFNFKVRVSDHPHTTQTTQDMSIHPGSRKKVQNFRTAVRKHTGERTS